MKTVYPIYEYFATFQGEGVYMGLPAFFVRTHGCPVQCPWCDSAGTWHPDFIPKDVERLTSQQIVDAVKAEEMDRVVITGGEPAIHDLTDLTSLLHQNNITVHLETSGSFPIRGMFDWITLSPKKWKLPLASCVEAAHEFKIIVEQSADIHNYHGILLANGLKVLDRRPIWLHPEWSKHNEQTVRMAIIEAVKASGGLFRAGCQLHKYYNVDAQDSRARQLVPLGGNPDKGY